MYGFGFDPEVPAGYQDADIEMAELAAAADEESAKRRYKPVVPHESHWFRPDADHDNMECFFCMCRPYSQGADKPCPENKDNR